MTVQKLCHLAVLLGTLALVGCEVGSRPDLEVPDTNYAVSVKPSTNGSVVAIPDRATEGTGIRFSINPDPGYKLSSLKFHQGGQGNLWGQNQTNVNQNSQLIYNLDMPVGGAWVTAEFTPLLTGERSVTLNTGDHGSVIATPTSGPAGTVVRLVSNVESGYAVGTGFPKVVGGTWITGREGLEFTIDGSANVTVTTNFERPTSIDALLLSARSAMDVEDYDAAFNDYEIAYQANPSNDEAIFYSTLGKLLSIPTTAKVRTLFRTPGMLGISTPTTITDWLDLGTSRATNWLASYTDDNGDSYKLPRLGSPSNYPGGFLNYTLATKNAGKRRLFDILLFWNLLGNNPNGFNTFFDHTVKYVFGDEFEEACRRESTLSRTATIVLHPNLKAKFGLEELYGSGTTSVGKADLDMLIGFLRSIKASFEWASSYDWQMDLTIFRVESDDQSSLNDILQRMLRIDMPLDKELKVSGNNSCLANILPLRSLLMRDRNNGAMALAKADFQSAVQLVDGSIDTFYGRFSATAQAKYQWMSGSQGFVRQLRSAVDSGGAFYWPEVPQYKSVFDAMAGRKTWIDSTSASLGVNLGNLFVPGYLSADHLVTTETGGKAPLFYGLKNGIGTPIASATDIDNYNAFALEFGQNFKNVFVKLGGKDAQSYHWVSDIFPQVFPQTDVADMEKAKENIATLYDFYQRR